MLSGLESNPQQRNNQNTYGAERRSTVDRFRHPSKNETEMKNQIKSMYTRGNFGDVEEPFSQTIIKSLEINQ